MDRGAWEATVHGVTESWTQLSDFTFLSFRVVWEGQWSQLCRPQAVLTGEGCSHSSMTTPRFSV